MAVFSFNPCCRGSGIPGIKMAVAGIGAKCFNPCCRGSGIPGSFCGRFADAFTLVSILVVVDQAFQVFFRPQFQSISLTFQSLLSWIRHSRLTLRNNSALNSLVSILVVVDQAFQASENPTSIPCEEFQSLLSWIRHSRFILLYLSLITNVYTNFQRAIFYLLEYNAYRYSTFITHQ
ncbi:hypothetical protein HRM2_05540 [Desulforapulum autotrophicum HRM2]|uniref:Uncharacterized protein n=1 Tax=Desulforapulum autotrophicum (strain ATCC 43914 / DSM 3382 / VKM B-1955 / HRM2) TaxID=177437 RepID=C0QHW0_DESAH|nr:hypothetical protein HRM2_05540 [Desulforapulum autotrophicum HRM2]